MTFQPILPYGGTAGWLFLQRTQAAQQAAFESSPEVQRDVDDFRARIGEVESPADLVSDYRLLKVALGAFGLDDDLPNRAYIEKVLEEGSIDPESFANRMVDKRYLALTEAFGFDLGTPNTKLSGFADRLLDSYATRQFEIAVGAQDDAMRLALALDRDLTEIAQSDNTDDGRWFAVMGSAPMRKLFETALGLPSEVALLDIDRQVGVFRDRAEALFGTGEVADLAEPGRMAEVKRLFLVRSEIAAGEAALSSGAIALTLLQGAR